MRTFVNDLDFSFALGENAINLRVEMGG